MKVNVTKAGHYAKVKGDTVRFKISSADPYPNPNCSSQNIQFKASGGNLSSASNYSNPNNCLFNPPCATLSSLNPGNVFTYPGINNVQFNWYIDCNHLFYQQYQCGALKSEYSFYLRMQDDQCPINRFAYKKVVVQVKNYHIVVPQRKDNRYLISYSLGLGKLLIRLYSHFLL